MNRTTYFSLLPDELLYELLVNVLISDNQSDGDSEVINISGVNNFVKSIPRLQVLLSRKKNISVLIDKYTHTLDIIRMLKYEYFSDIRTYLSLFYMLYLSVTLNNYKNYAFGIYMLYEGNTIRELNSLNRVTRTVAFVHAMKIKFKYFYTFFIKSGIIEALINIGRNTYDYVNLYTDLENLYGDYTGVKKILYTFYYNKNTLVYIFTGNIPHDYKLSEFNFLGEMY